MHAGYHRAKELHDGSDPDTDLPSTSRGSTGVRGRAHLEGQNIKASRIYVFGEGEVYEDNEGAIEMPEIRSRKATKYPTAQTFNNDNTIDQDGLVFERDIIIGDDTLQSIALQYGCRVSELKRLNKLITDQDFFRLKTVKVPIKQHGLISELVQQDKTNSSKGKQKGRANGTARRAQEEYTPNNFGESDDNDSYPDNYLSEPENQQLLIRTLSIRDTINSQSVEAENFLSNMDKDLKKFRLSANSYKPSLQEVTHSLTQKRIQPLKKNQHWTDCGLSWCNIVTIVIIVGLLLPLFGGLYYYFWYYHHH